MQFVDETTPELWWPQSISVYDQMRRSDSQVASVLRAVTLPVRRTPWRIDPNGARDEVVEFVADDLGLPIVGASERTAPRSKDRFSWPEHLRHALLMLPFGHVFFEMIYRVDNGGERAHLRKLGPRLPKTIEKIDVAEDGGLISITQYWTQTDRRPQPIPVNRLVAYVHEREGGNWLGQSILRSAYKNFLLKERLLRVQAQTIERNGMGIPLYKDAEGATDAAHAAGLAMAKAWRSGEAAGSAIPFGSDLTLVGVSGTLPDADPVVRYHDEAIARAVLAHFLNLGTQTGSWALGTTFADFFTMSLQTLAEQIADTATQHIVEDIIDVNWGPEEPAPKIVFDEIGSRQQATAQSLVALFGAGALTPDQRLEESLRQQYGLPPKEQPADATGTAAPLLPPDQAQAQGPAQPEPVLAGGVGPKVVDQPVSASIDDDEDDEPGQFEDVDTAALVAAVAAFCGEVHAAEFNDKLHPRGAGGRFRNTFARIVRALEDWENGDSPSNANPFEGHGFTREQLRDAAKKRGVTLRRGASESDIVEALKADVRVKRGGAKSPDAGKPVRFTLTGGGEPRKAGQVKGRNIADDHALISAAFEAGKEGGEWGPSGAGLGSQHGGRSEPDAGGYQAHLFLAKAQGFDGLPRVVDASGPARNGESREWAKLESAGWRQLYRGWGWGRGEGPNADKTGEDMAREYLYGPLHVGGGVGLGTNMSDDFDAADNYARKDRYTRIPGGVTASFLLAPDAKVISYPDAVKRRDAYLAKLPAGPEHDAERAVFEDPGTFAMALGYDAMVATHDDHPVVKRGTEEWVIFNRTKVAAWEDNPEAAKAWKAAHKPTVDSKLRNLDVGVFHENGKLALWEVSDSGERRKRVALVDDLAGLESWADEHGESELAGWARKERGGGTGAGAPEAADVPAKAAPAKKATTARTVKTAKSAIAEAKREADVEDAAERADGLWVAPRHPSMNTPYAAGKELDRSHNQDQADDALEGLTLAELREVAQAKGVDTTGRTAERVRREIVDGLTPKRPDWPPTWEHVPGAVDRALDDLAKVDWSASEGLPIDPGRGALDHLSLREHKELARRIGLPMDVLKSKPEWGDAIQGAFAAGAKATPAKKATKATKAAPTAAPDVNALRTLDTEHRRDALDLRKVDDLKALLREQGLPVSGRKRDLVDRLVGHLEGDGGGKPAAKAPAAVSGVYNGPVFKMPQNVDEADLVALRGLLQGEHAGTLTPEEYSRLFDLRAKLSRTVVGRVQQDVDIDSYFNRFREERGIGGSSDSVQAQMADHLKATFADRKVAVRVTPTNLGKILDDGRMKTQFESGTSSGLFLRDTRSELEGRLFGLAEDADPKIRPIYGYVMIDGERPAGVRETDALSAYGRIQVVLKDSVRDRTTAMIGDSLDLFGVGRPSPINNPDWRSFTPLSRGSFGRALGDQGIDRTYGDAFHKDLYAEAQIHGGVNVSDIEEVVLPGPPSAALRRQLDKAGIKWRVLK
jgi:hypothetical protein